MIVYILDPLKKGRTQRLNLYGGFTLQLFLKLVQEIYETGENRNLYMNYIRQQMGCDKAYIHASSLKKKKKKVKWEIRWRLSEILQRLY